MRKRKYHAYHSFLTEHCDAFRILLHRHKKKHKKTLQQLANETGLSVGTLHAFFRDKHVNTIFTLWTLDEYLQKLIKEGTL